MTDRTFPFRARRAATVLGVAFGVLQLSANIIALVRAWRGDRRPGLPLAQLAGIGWASALILIALSGRRAAVRLEDTGIDVDFGWLWRQRLPYDAIGGVRAVEHPPWMGYGIRTNLHGWIALIWWGRRVVAVILDPPRRLPLVPFVPLPGVRELRLGLEDDAAFRDALTARLDQLRSDKR